MQNALKALDFQLNKFTMYAGTLNALRGLVAIALVLSILGAISISPLAIIATVLTLATSCYVSNYAFAKLFKVDYNTSSWTITSLILFFMITPRLEVGFLLLAALTGALATASKYLITWRGSHFLNPAATGAVIVSVTGMLSVGWWVATPWMVLFTALFGLIVLHRQHRFSLFFAFAITATLTLVLVNAIGSQPQSIPDVLRAAVVSWPIIFLGVFMLTEPISLPAGRYYQILTAIIVGLIFSSQLHIGPVSSTPHVALLIGNIFAAIVSPPFGATFKLKRSRELAPGITELTFEKPKQLKFQAGQYMEWTLKHADTDGRGNRRSFSLASAPSEDEISIAVRTYKKGSSYKKALLALEPGHGVRASNVSGDFVWPTGSSPLLLIAGGIGITPFRSQLQQLIMTGKQRDVIVVYIASKQEQFVYKDVLDVAANHGVKTEYVIGRIDGQALTELVPDFAKREIFISGPDAMVSDFSSGLRQQGAPRKHIHTDHFSGY
jgi:ferredoxin-NADP reductase